MTSVWIFMYMFCSLVSAEASLGTSPEIKLKTDASRELHGEMEFECHQTEEDLCQIIEKMCKCVSISSPEIPFEKWHIIYKWMKKCIEECDIHNSGNETKEDPKWYHPDGIVAFYNRYKDKVTDMYYLYLSLEDISGILRSVVSYNITYHTYLSYYRNMTFAKRKTQCNNSSYLKFIEQNGRKLANIYNNILWVYVFQKYIQVVISLIVLIPGILMTGLFLIIFMKHKKIRTESNIVVFNIAICDFLHIIMFYPLFFLFFDGIYPNEKLFRICGDMLCVLSSANALSILALSLQRFCAVKGLLHDACYNRFRKLWRITLFFLFAWTPGIFYVCLVYAVWPNGREPYIVVIELAIAIVGFFLIAFPLAITVINCSTSRELRKSAREFPGEQIHDKQVEARYRSAKVVNILCVVYWITHFPQFIGFHIALSVLSEDIDDLNMKYVIFCVSIMFFLNATLNPVALIITSKNIRDLYNRYLFRCSHVNIDQSSH